MCCIRFMKKVLLLFSDRNIPLQSTPYAIYVSSKWEYPARIKRQLILTIQSETPSSRNSNAREDDNRITQIHISGDDAFVVPAVSVEIDID